MPRRSTHTEVFEKPETGRTTDRSGAAAKGYKVVSVSLYSDQAEVLDRAAEELALAGYSKANRSLVVQTAIQRPKEDLEGKSRQDVLRYFLEQQVKRPLSSARPRRAKILRSSVAIRKASTRKKSR